MTVMTACDVQLLGGGVWRENQGISLLIWGRVLPDREMLKILVSCVERLREPLSWPLIAVRQNFLSMSLRF